MGFIADTLASAPRFSVDKGQSVTDEWGNEIGSGSFSFDPSTVAQGSDGRWYAQTQAGTYAQITDPKNFIPGSNSSGTANWAGSQLSRPDATLGDAVKGFAGVLGPMAAAAYGGSALAGAAGAAGATGASLSYPAADAFGTSAGQFGFGSAGTTAAGAAGTAANTLAGSGVTDEMLLTGQATSSGGTAAGDVSTGFTGAGSGAFGSGVPAAATTASGISSASSLAQNLGNLAQGAAGLVTASGLKSSATTAAASADPFAASRASYNAPLATSVNAQATSPVSSYANTYGKQLQDLMANPTASLTSIPGYEAGIQAVERSGAAQGYTGSGNMMTALQQYGGSFYQQQLQNLMALTNMGTASQQQQTGNLMGLTGANFNNAPQAAQIAQTGATNAAALTGNALNPLVQGAVGLAGQAVSGG